MKSNRVKLGEIAEIRAGYPFRGQIKNTASGEVRVVQMKHLNAIDGVAWDELVTTNLEGRRNPNWLEKDDIIFVARGNNNCAVCLEEIPGRAVCSPHFFQIQITDPSKILPCFVAWQINQAPVQQYLASSSEGTMIRSIRRGVLESLQIVIPEIHKQKVIVELSARVNQEHILLQQQMNNSRAMMNAIARDLLK